MRTHAGAVIVSEAKRSSPLLALSVLLRRFAPRNDAQSPSTRHGILRCLKYYQVANPQPNGRGRRPFLEFSPFAKEKLSIREPNQRSLLVTGGISWGLYARQGLGQS